MNIPDKAKRAGTDALGDYVERCNEWDTEDAAEITLWGAAPFIAARILRDVADVMEDQPVVDMTSVAYLRGRANGLDPA